MAPRFTPIALGISILGLAALPATAFPDPGTLVLTQSGAVLTLDPATGVRTELSGFSTGTGTNFSSRPNDLVREETGHFVVSDFDVQALIRVDATTGNRTVLASSSVGSGGSFRPGAIEIDGDTHFDPENFGTLLVWNTLSNAIERVDPVSGDRTVAVSGSAGGAPILSAVQDMLRIGPGFGFRPFDHLNDVVVSDSNLDALVRVSTFTGERTVLSSASVGSGPVFDTPRGIAMVLPPNATAACCLTFYVVDSGVDAVFSVGTNGDRQIVSSSSVGTGPSFQLPWNIWPSADNKGLFVADAELESVLYVDIASGNRVIVADASTGSGPALNAVKSFTAVPVPVLAWGFEDETPGAPPAYTAFVPPEWHRGSVTVEHEDDFAGSVQAAEGSQLLYLTSGPGDRGETSGTSQFDESMLLLLVHRGQNAPRRLSFAVDTLTHEGSKPDPTDVLASGYNSIWFLPLARLSMQTVNPGTSSPFPFGGVPYTALTGFAEGPISGPDGSFFGKGHAGYQTYEVDVDFPGVALWLRVADQTDAHDDTAMLIDDIRFVPEPGAAALLAPGGTLLGLLARRRARDDARKRAGDGVRQHESLLQGAQLERRRLDGLLRRRRHGCRHAIHAATRSSTGVHQMQRHELEGVAIHAGVQVIDRASDNHCAIEDGSVESVDVRCFHRDGSVARGSETDYAVLFIEPVALPWAGAVRPGPAPQKRSRRAGPRAADSIRRASSSWPATSASASAVLPSASRTWVRAPRSSSSSTTSE